MNTKIVVEHDDTYEINLLTDIKEDNHSLTKSGIDLRISSGLFNKVREIDKELAAVLRFLAASFVASIALARLGDPLQRDTVQVQIDGVCPAYIKRDLEKILRLFMVSRTLPVRYPLKCARVVVKPGSHIHRRFSYTSQSKKIVCGLSGGIDSTAALKYAIEKGFNVLPIYVKYSFLNDVWYGESSSELSAYHDVVELLERRGYPLQVTEIEANLSALKTIPFNNYIQDLDIDCWDYYGRDAFLSVLLLAKGYLQKARYLMFGHTRGACDRTSKNQDLVLYDFCGQSLAFIYIINLILSKLFGKGSVNIYLPFGKMYKGSIGKYFIKDLQAFCVTHSCIQSEPMECGTCFSCLDKLCIILGCCELAELEFVQEDDYYSIKYRDKILGKFQQLPFLMVEEDFLIWGEQIQRLAKQHPDISHKLKNSAFSFQSIIGAVEIIKSRALDYRQITSKFPFFEYYSKVLSELPEDCLKNIRNGHLKLQGVLITL